MGLQYYKYRIQHYVFAVKNYGKKQTNIYLKVELQSVG